MDKIHMLILNPSQSHAVPPATCNHTRCNLVMMGKSWKPCSQFVKLLKYLTCAGLLPSLCIL